MDAIVKLSEYFPMSEKRKIRYQQLLKLLYNDLVIAENYQDSLVDIAKRINVERKTLYRYFRSKEDILSQLYVITKVNLKQQLMKKIKLIKAESKLSVMEHFYIILDLHVEYLLMEHQETGFIKYYEQNYNLKCLMEQLKSYLQCEQPDYYVEVVNEMIKQEFFLVDISAKNYGKIIEQTIESYYEAISKYQVIDEKYQFINLEILTTIIKHTVLEQNKL